MKGKPKKIEVVTHSKYMVISRMCTRKEDPNDKWRKCKECQGNKGKKTNKNCKIRKVYANKAIKEK